MGDRFNDSVESAEVWIVRHGERVDEVNAEIQREMNYDPSEIMKRRRE